MNFIIYNKEKFQTTSCVHSVKQRISIIFLDQMPTHIVLKKNTFHAGIKIFNSETILKKDKAKFNAA